MAAVIGRSKIIAQDFHTIGRVRGGFGDRSIRLTPERVLNSGCTVGDMADAGYSYGCTVDPGTRFLETHRDSNHRIAGRRVMKFLVSYAFALRSGNSHLGDDLVRPEFCSKHSGEEPRCRDATFAAAADHHDLSIEGEDGSGII